LHLVGHILEYYTQHNSCYCEAHLPWCYFPFLWSYVSCT